MLEILYRTTENTKENEQFRRIANLIEKTFNSLGFNGVLIGNPKNNAIPIFQPDAILLYDRGLVLIDFKSHEDVTVRLPKHIVPFNFWKQKYDEMSDFCKNISEKDKENYRWYFSNTKSKNKTIVDFIKGGNTYLNPFIQLYTYKLCMNEFIKENKKLNVGEKDIVIVNILNKVTIKNKSSLKNYPYYRLLDEYSLSGFLEDFKSKNRTDGYSNVQGEELKELFPFVEPWKKTQQDITPIYSPESFNAYNSKELKEFERLSAEIYWLISTHQAQIEQNYQSDWNKIVSSYGQLKTLPNYQIIIKLLNDLIKKNETFKKEQKQELQQKKERKEQEQIAKLEDLKVRAKKRILKYKNDVSRHLKADWDKQVKAISNCNVLSDCCAISDKIDKLINIIKNEKQKEKEKLEILKVDIKKRISEYKNNVPKHLKADWDKQVEVFLKCSTLLSCQAISKKINKLVEELKQEKQKEELRLAKKAKEIKELEALKVDTKKRISEYKDYVPKHLKADWDKQVHAFSRCRALSSCSTISQKIEKLAEDIKQEKQKEVLRLERELEKAKKEAEDREKLHHLKIEIKRIIQNNENNIPSQLKQDWNFQVKAFSKVKTFMDCVQIGSKLSLLITEIERLEKEKKEKEQLRLQKIYQENQKRLKEFEYRCRGLENLHAPFLNYVDRDLAFDDLENWEKILNLSGVYQNDFDKLSTLEELHLSRYIIDFSMLEFMPSLKRVSIGGVTPNSNLQLNVLENRIQDYCSSWATVEYGDKSNVFNSDLCLSREGKYELWKLNVNWSFLLEYTWECKGSKTFKTLFSKSFFRELAIVNEPCYFEAWVLTHLPFCKDIELEEIHFIGMVLGCSKPKSNEYWGLDTILNRVKVKKIKLHDTCFLYRSNYYHISKYIEKYPETVIEDGFKVYNSIIIKNKSLHK